MRGDVREDFLEKVTFKAGGKQGTAVCMWPLVHLSKTVVPLGR